MMMMMMLLLSTIVIVVVVADNSDGGDDVDASRRMGKTEVGSNAKVKVVFGRWLTKPMK